VIKWNVNIINGSVSEGSNKNCIYIDSNGDAFVHQCSNGFEKFKALPLVDYHEQHYKVKQQFINADKNDDATHPNPDPIPYLAGNLANNFLAIKLLWYGPETFELEIVHRSFLTPSSANLVYTYIITHIHTIITYSTSGSIVDIMNKIVADISQIPSITFGMDQMMLLPAIMV